MKNTLKYLSLLGIAILSIYGISKASTIQTSVPALFETYLSAQQSSTDSTLTLASVTLRDGTSLTGYQCVVVDSNSPTTEFECGTVSGNTLTGLVRGIDAVTGTTTVTALKYAHRLGADVKVSDYPILSQLARIINGYDSFPNGLSFAGTPLAVGTTTSDSADFGGITVWSQANQNAGSFVGSSTSYFELTINNTAKSATSSTDLILGNDLNGLTPSSPNFNSYYTDLGMDSSGGTVYEPFTAIGANDSYLYSSDGSFMFGTASTTNTNAVIKFVSGGTDSQNIQAQISATGTQFLTPVVGLTPTLSSQLATKGYVDGVAIAGAPISSSVTTGIARAATSSLIESGSSGGTTTPYFIPSTLASSTSAKNNIVVVTNSTGSIDSSFIASTSLASAGIVKTFGGTGSDGALTVSSGTTTISCAGAQICQKNYTSISITGTGAVVFSNPHANGTLIILKSQGNVTLTSSAVPMISSVGMGGAGGALGATGTSGLTPLIKSNGGTSLNGGGGSLTAGSAGNGGGTGGATSTYALEQTFNWTNAYNKYPFTFIGAGGGGGANNGGTGGIGGNGGGALVIECAGAWNFTTANGISVAGQAGANAASTGYPGGGGGAGSFLGLYNTLTANSGTVNISGGASGTGGQGGSGTGGNGSSLVTANTEY